MSNDCRHGERGFALASTLIVVASIGLMISGVFLLGVSELRQGRSAVLMEQAFRLSENGAAIMVGSLRAGPLPDTTIRRLNGTSPIGRYETTMSSPGGGHSLIRSVGYSRGGLARQEMGVLIEHRIPDLGGDEAAMTVVDVLVAGPGLLVSGLDDPSVFPQCSSDGDRIGVRVASISQRDSILCAGCFEGAPAVYADSSVGDSVLIPSFNLLAAQADKTFQGGTLSLVGPTYLPKGECNYRDVTNWGDFQKATGPCGSYRPVIYSKGDLRIVGGSGQGVILVDGDLELTGGFEFAGIVVVKGDLRIGDSGARLFGAVTVQAAFFPQNPVLPGPFIQFSSCAAKRALEAHLVPVVLKQRSWVALY